MGNDKQLEQLMYAYKVQSASDDLADKIILATKHIKQRQNIWNWINRIFDEFRLPVPRYSLASLFIIGLLVGFLFYDYIDSINIKDTYEVSDNTFDQFLYEDEALL